jgi:trimethylamine---corrinoid protein Co-methyltransferase
MTRKTMSVLDQAALERIHKESVRVLEDVGIQCDDVESARILCRAGAKAVGQTGVVRLPAPKVEEAMAQITKRFEMVHPSGERFWAPPPKPMAGTRVKMPKILDYGAVDCRRPARQDVINLCRLTNSLNGCKLSVSVAFPSSDVPAEIDIADTLSLVYGVTGHHTMFAAPTVEDARTAIDASIVATGSADTDNNPGMFMEVNTTSPLRLGAKEGGILRHIVSRHIPIDICPVCIAGGTAPFTLAGALLIGNAEMLFLCVLANAIWPGAKILHATTTSIMNMKSASISWGSPEACLLSSGEIALAHYYGMPSHRMGCYSDSYYSDEQAGIEKGAAELTLTLSGADFVYNGGPLNNAAHHSYEQLLIDHDIWEFCERAATEIEVNDETLASDAIRRIGPGGSYLSDDHTMQWLRSGEHYYGGSFNHTGRPGEGNTMLARAHRRVEKILSEPFKWGAPPDAVARLKQFMRDYARERGVPAPEWTE